MNIYFWNHKFITGIRSKSAKPAVANCVSKDSIKGYFISLCTNVNTKATALRLEAAYSHG